MKAGMVSLAVCVVVVLPMVISICPQACVSDMQCKGFTAVNPLVYCYRNCCSSKDTVVAYYRDTMGCVGDMEGWTTSDANAYPWLAFVIIDQSPQCVSCVGVLISQTYIMTDTDCANAAATGDTTNIYFNFDDPFTRQLYTPLSFYDGSDLPGVDIVKFVEITYAGTGVPLPLTPMPVSCADLTPSSATFFHWELGTDPIGTRTFNLSAVQVMNDARCQDALSLGYIFTNDAFNYFCVDGSEENDMLAYYDAITVGDSYCGALLMTQDANGNWLLIGEGLWAGYTIPNPNYPGNWTVLLKTAKAMNKSPPNMRTLFGATCA